MIRPGDVVRIRRGRAGFEGGPAAEYRVKSVDDFGVAWLYGGRPNKERYRAVAASRLVKRRTARPRKEAV